MKRKLLLALTSVLFALALVVPSQASADDGKNGALLTCTTSNNQIWNIAGGYTDPNIAPQVSLYQGSQYIQRFTGDQTTKHADVLATVSAQTTAQTYTLYDSADNSGAAVATVVCPAKTVAAAPTTQQPAAQTTTPTAATTDTTSTPATASTTETKTPKNTDTDTTNQLNAFPTAKKQSISASVLAAILIPLSLFLLLMLVSLWIAFRKAGRPGWGAIIPIYNTWLIFEMGGKPGWWALVMCIPFVNLIALVMYALATIEISERFGKSSAFGIFYLFLFGFIGWPYLAFSKTHYTEPNSTTTNQPGVTTDTVES